MIRYFLTVILILFAALWAADFLIVNVEQRVYDDMIRPSVHYVAEGTGKLVGERLAGLTGPDLVQEVDRLERLLKLPVRLIPIEDAPNIEEEIFVQIPTRDTGLVVIIGPAPIIVEESADDMPSLLPGILLIVIPIGLLLVVPLARQIRKHEIVISKIAEGDFTARVPEGSTGILGQLETRINLMAGRIQELVNEQRHLLQAVAHEMRTPAARMRFGFELISDAKSEVEQKRLLSTIDQDMTELDELLQDLLIFMRQDDSKLPAIEPIDVAQLLALLTSQVTTSGSKIQIKVIPSQESDTGKVVYADYRSLRCAVQNLLTNAIKHSTDAILIVFGDADGKFQIEVHDDGPGVPVADRERVFAPFTRLDSSRSRDSGGAGLGLAIAQRAAARIQGSISIDDSPLGGACFNIKLPHCGDHDNSGE